MEIPKVKYKYLKIVLDFSTSVSILSCRSKPKCLTEGKHNIYLGHDSWQCHNIYWQPNLFISHFCIMLFYFIFLIIYLGKRRAISYCSTAPCPVKMMLLWQVCQLAKEVSQWHVNPLKAPTTNLVSQASWLRSSVLLNSRHEQTSTAAH